MLKRLVMGATIKKNINFFPPAFSSKVSILICNSTGPTHCGWDPNFYHFVWFLFI